MVSIRPRSLRKDRRAVSPAISTVILTSAVIVMIMVVMLFSNSYLDTRMAENEFLSNKQFMLTAGLQVDDIAWTIGRTQTVRFSSRYGSVELANAVVNYTFEAWNGATWTPLGSWLTGIISFNMPVQAYTLGNGYNVCLYPSNRSFLQGPSASTPVTQVIVIEKLPMTEGNFTRIVAVPMMRMLNSTIYGTPTQNYYKFYLPTLTSGTNQYLSQSVTLTGRSITKLAMTGVNQVRVNVTFPKAVSDGFDYTFFNFNNTIVNPQTPQGYYTETYSLATGSTVELYVATVAVSLGLTA
jgi:hypothetical protein